MAPDWILVANASQARLLQMEHGGPLVVLHAFHHPASRLRSHQLGDDARGREASDRSFGGAAYESRVEPQRKEHEKFAREIAGYLEARRHAMRRLHVFASSAFLGDLKAHFGPATLRSLAGSHDIDLAGLELGEIERRVQSLLQPAG